MLSEQHRALIKATIPLLEQGGEALTTHFYQKLFRDHPEVKALFNQAHQASGAQPRALANSVLMYARHIDHLEALGPLAAQIVNKHVALQVLPEHYPLVGSCLLQSIREVLGAEIATDAILEAWGAAYQQLADILIQAEEGVYAANAQASGGWRGARSFVLARREFESDEMISLYLEPKDGGSVLQAQAGQYIGVRWMHQGEELRRNYSLSQCSEGRGYRISVQRQRGGVVSNALHDTLKLGDSIDVFPPAGNFVLDQSSQPIALISGGSGITPSIALLEAALKTQRPVYFIHCARHAGVHAFRDWVNAQAQQYPQLQVHYCYSEPRPGDLVEATGYLTADLLQTWIPALTGAHYYCTGPQAFIQANHKSLLGLGVADAQIHTEFFGPAVPLEA